MEKTGKLKNHYPEQKKSQGASPIQEFHKIFLKAVHGISLEKQTKTESL